MATTAEDKRLRRASLWLLVALLTMLLLTSCGQDGAQDEQSEGTSNTPAASTGQQGGSDGQVAFTFANGRQGGSQYPISVALMQIVDELPWVSSTTIRPGGATANIVSVAENQAHAGIVVAYSTIDGYKGQGAFEKPYDSIRELFALHPFKVVIVVRQDSDIRSVEDLVGKRVNVGPAGFTTVDIANLIWEVHGIDPSQVDVANLQITDAVEQFKDGHIDAILYTLSDQMAPYIDLAQSADIRVLPIADDKLQEMIERNPSFYMTEWPTEAGIYRGIDEPVKTVGYPNNVIATEESLTEQQAYDIVKAIAENLERVQQVEPSLNTLKPEDLARDIGIPFHPGAEKYFRERGWIK